MLIFDDYCWDLLPHAWQRPKVAIDAFLQCYAPELLLLHSDLQVRASLTLTLTLTLALTLALTLTLSPTCALRHAAWARAEAQA